MSIFKFICVILFLTLFISCSVFNPKTLRVESHVLKEVWQTDPCGTFGNRQGIALLIEDLCNKKAIDFPTLTFIVGKPAKIDTLDDHSIKYSYIALSGIKECDLMPYNDVVHLGLIVFYDFKKNKIRSCQINLY